MAKWIKLARYEDDGSVWYTLPGSSKRLEFKDGDRISCKFQDDVHNSPIEFHYNIEKTIMKDGIPYVTHLRSPCVQNKAKMFVQLSDIDVDEEEVRNFEAQKGDI